MKKQLSYLLLLILINSCQKATYSNESMISYEQGMKYFKQAMLDSGKTGFQEALLYFNESVNHDSANISSYYWKMFCEVKLAEIDLAYTTSKKALNVIGDKTHPLKPSFYVAIGMIEKRNGNEDAFIYNYTQAIKLFEQRLRKDPKNIDSISNKAILLCSVNDKPGAIKFLDSSTVDKDWEQALDEVKNSINDFNFEKHLDEFFNQ